VSRDAGKGDTPRPMAVSFRTFAENWARTFGQPSDAVRPYLTGEREIPGGEITIQRPYGIEMPTELSIKHYRRTVDAYADYRTLRALSLPALPPRDAA
jgi:hypothetical protein